MKTWVKVLLIACILAVLVLVLSQFIDLSMISGNAILQEGSIKEFISCLNEKDVVLFVFDGNPQSNAQLEMFGNYSSNLSVVDCRLSPMECRGVIIHPSWKIEGRIISSGLSMGTLSQLSGCRLG